MPARRTPTRAKSNGDGKLKAAKHDAVVQDNESTPAKVVDAAIACILEEGFYRASSNEIARRADVTWGVIQYHFGTREALLLGVLQRAAAELQRDLTKTQITGKTLGERIEQLAEFVWAYYARPEFLAYMQVMLNLSHDPTTESQTRAAMDENQIHVSTSLPKLLRDVIGDAAPSNSPEVGRLSTYIFGALRGMAIDQGHLEALPNSRSDRDTNIAHRKMLVASLETYVESVLNPKRRSRLHL